MLTAAEIMNREVISVAEDLSISELMPLLLKHRISGVPVVNQEGKLTGMVCESDLIEQSKNLHLPTMITILDAVIFLESTKKMEKELKKMAGSKVRDIMTSPVMTVEENTSLSEIASIMTENRKYLLPVMRGEKLVGIIGKADIVRAMSEGG